MHCNMHTLHTYEQFLHLTVGLDLFSACFFCFKSIGLAVNRSWVQILHNNLGQQPFPICASVIKQYNLVPAKGQCCSVAGKVTAGLLKSNGSLPPCG